MKVRIFLATGFCSILLGAGGAFGQDQQVLDFADHLFKQGDYYRAITEYERFTYLFPTNPLVCRARYSVALCYCKGGKFDAAVPVLQSVRDDYRGQDEAGEAVFTLAEIYYRMGKYASALSTLRESSVELDKTGGFGKRLILSGLCYLRLDDRDGAIENARKVASDSSLRHAALGLEKAARDFPEDEKSPLLAGALSAVLPGAGQLYVGRRRDAVMAFALNGLLIAGIVSAFHNDEPVAGSALAIIETAWYSGNVYGAVNGAHKRNAMRRQRFFSEVEFRLNILSDWTLTGTSLKPAVCVGVRF